MIRTILAGLIALGLSVSTSFAQSCSTLPYTLTNGTTADATQVMANFNYLLSCITGLPTSIASLQGYLGGLTTANDPSSGSVNSIIDTASGVTESDDVTTMMALPTFTKNVGAAWAVGTGNGCLDAGSLAANTWYHLFVIERTDTGVVDEVCTASTAIPPSPTMPASYTKKRRIGSFKTDGSSHILQFVQNGDEFIWATSVATPNTSIGVSARTAIPLAIPPGVKVNALFRAGGYNASGTWEIILTSLDETDQAPSIGSVGGNLEFWAFGGYVSAGRFNVRSDTASQIYARAAVASTTMLIDTFGWIDTRGRFN